MDFFEGATVAVTGGTGSFGQAVIKELLKTKVRVIRLISRNEYLQVQMRRVFGNDRLHYKIGDIREKDTLERIFTNADFVIHAAALKHVMTGETNPQEVVKTNVLGSTNVLEVAAKCHVARVLGISSDKAVNPVSLYGMTKGVMEKMFIEANRWAWPATAFSIMRSGNFFNSSGNVFEVWEEQSKTGEIYLTDEGMYRYFIETEKAAKFALFCLEYMTGGEIFIPQMKEYSMIELAKTRYPNCKIRDIGMGNSERLHEPLWAETEHPQAYPNYWVIDNLKGDL